jgi:mRNA-degrading endonuclease RelE of RelBE toxin-antitoxin system
MQVVLSKEAKKQYNHLPAPEQKKVKKRLFSLTTESSAGKKLSGELADQRSLRAWPYRVIYSINEKEKRVEVISILHRQGAYK